MASGAKRGSCREPRLLAEAPAKLTARSSISLTRSRSGGTTRAMPLRR
jgi:hypothetical protein